MLMHGKTLTSPVGLLTDLPFVLIFLFRLKLTLGGSV